MKERERETEKDRQGRKSKREREGDLFQSELQTLKGAVCLALTIKLGQRKAHFWELEEGLRSVDTRSSICNVFVFVSLVDANVNSYLDERKKRGN